MKNSNLELYDNTRLVTHRKCNRKYYWRHVRHLVPVGIAPALVFGGSWHSAMDAVWTMAKDRSLDPAKLAQFGYVAFCEEWTSREGFKLWQDMSMEEQEVFGFRHDQTAMGMLLNYCEQRLSMIHRMELIEVERPFAVPLDPDDPTVFYVGRLDKLVNWESAIWTIEHKTTSLYRKNGYFAPAFLENFSPNSQVDGYLHAMHMIHGHKAKGVMIDAALVHKTVHEGFTFIPVERSINNLSAWQWEAQHEVALIRNSMKHVDKFQDAPFLPAFPKNTEACIEFNLTCPYLDLCRFVDNPTKDPDREFPGFKVERWEPFEELKLHQLFGDENEG